MLCYQKKTNPKTNELEENYKIIQIRALQALKLVVNCAVESTCMNYICTKAFLLEMEIEKNKLAKMALTSSVKNIVKIKAHRMTKETVPKAMSTRLLSSFFSRQGFIQFHGPKCGRLNVYKVFH